MGIADDQVLALFRETDRKFQETDRKWKETLQRMNQFRTWLPRSADNRLHGAVAWLTAEAGAEVRAITKGWLSIHGNGGSGRMMNTDDFLPRVW